MAARPNSTAARLLPELFPVIASHLPLYATPSTLLALALTNHGIYEIVHNLLYSCLILRNEKDTLSTFQRILTSNELGYAVRELHVMSELSAATRKGETAFDAVTGLISLVCGGYLPYVHTLSLHLSENWRMDENWNDVTGFGHLPSPFWEDLGAKCPRLRAVVLSGLGDRLNDPWIHGSGIYELKGMKELTHLGLTFSRSAQAQHDGTDRLLKNIHYLSSSLHTLVLRFYFQSDSASPILCLDFPQLISLTLASLSIPDVSEAMAFWRRHPTIEKLRLQDTNHTDHWFSETEDDDLFPNLKYLEASFHDVRSLLPILPRLIGLSINQSLNAQVPYLLRSLIPGGLPNLASLEIDQDGVYDGRSVHNHEGIMWYETLDGKFTEKTNFSNAVRLFTDGYIHSIVRGAPNLEELCLHGLALHPARMELLAPQLAGFARLERLYYRGLNDSELSLRTPENRAAFYTSSWAIAVKCSSLERITDISTSTYLTTKIRRNHAGGVEEAISIEGYGMTIGAENEPFPRNSDPSF